MQQPSPELTPIILAIDDLRALPQATRLARTSREGVQLLQVLCRAASVEVAALNAAVQRVALVSAKKDALIELVFTAGSVFVPEGGAGDGAWGRRQHPAPALPAVC
ncbi:hypothetical protein ACH40D_44490 [Streptomyces olivaceoviridis]|uniref:Uncharacterized protein n=1 Tax=Streptomyces olivaceoviridis TaxID=1921 RepID=A0ABW7VPH5_STROI|nr:hypothetical protein [Streptomyces corchorusii]